MEKQPKIRLKNKMTMEEMQAYFASKSVYEPTLQRVGRFAKSIGYKWTKQIVKGKLYSFYVKINTI